VKPLQAKLANAWLRPWSCDLDRSDLQKRLEQSRHKQKQAEEEMENWRQELVKFNQWVCYIVSLSPSYNYIMVIFDKFIVRQLNCSLISCSKLVIACSSKTQLKQTKKHSMIWHKTCFSGADGSELQCSEPG